MARIGWDEVAPQVRAAIEQIAGARVVHVAPAEGGFSPCFAGRLDLADGRSVFAKAVSGAQNPESPDFLRKELATTSSVPASILAARLLGAVDDDGWVAGVFAYLPGRLPTLPWAAAELARAIESVASVGATVAPEGLPSVAHHLGPLFDGWRSLAAEGSVPEAWTGRIHQLVELEARSLVAADGDRLAHLDIRADNLIVTPEGAVAIIDWAYTSRGAGWLDVALWAPALELEGGGTPEEVLAAWPGVQPTRDALAAVVTGMSGYFVHRGGLPDPEGLPTLRAFQRAQAVPALAWLDRLLADPDGTG
jgi:hypothetical protein